MAIDRQDRDQTPTGMSAPAEGKCSAKKKNGLYCANVAGHGTDHKGYGRCYWHGGRTRNHRKNAAKQMALGEAGQLLAECRTVIGDRGTVEALQDLRLHAASMVMALRALIDALPFRSEWRFDHIPGAGGSAQRVVNVATEGMVGPDHQGDQKANVLVQLYGEWVDRSARIEKIAADLGLEARRVEIDQATAQLLMATLNAVLRDQGVDPALVLPELGQRLRAIDTTSSQ